MARCRINLLNVEFTDNYYDSAYWKLYDKYNELNNKLKNLIYQRNENSRMVYRLMDEIIFLEEKGKSSSCTRRRLLELKIENLRISAEFYALSKERDEIGERLEEFRDGARW